MNITDELTIIKYQRTTLRGWIAINGTEHYFITRREAELHALDHDAPAVAELVREMIADADEFDTKRIIKAGFILRDGLNLPPRDLHEYGSYVGELMSCRSQSGETWPDGSIVEHAVIGSEEAHGYSCTCEDWCGLRLGQIRHCKHIWAYIIWAGIMPPSSPIPFEGEPISPPDPLRECDGYGLQ